MPVHVSSKHGGPGHRVVENITVCLCGIGMRVWSGLSVLLPRGPTCVVLVINQLNAQNLVFIISLLYACTCFEHYVLIIRRSKL